MDQKQLKAAAAAKGFDVSVNQVGPLIEQIMAKGGLALFSKSPTDNSYLCSGYGSRIGFGKSPFEAALDMIAGVS